MLRTILKSKIKKVKVTKSSIKYEGSIGLPDDLIAAADLNLFEQVHVNNLSNGNRIITYVIRSNEKGSITINGAASKHFSAGDEIHILSFVQLSEDDVKIFAPKLIITDENNELLEILNYTDFLKKNEPIFPT